MIRVISLLGLCICVACTQPSEQKQASEQEETLEISKSEESVKKVAQLSLSEMTEAKAQYLVPSPGEILSSLDKLDRVSWGQLASYNAKADYDDNYQRALNLGVRVADAFMAVNAQDAPRFGEMSTIVFDLAREIGLGDVLEGKRGDLDNLAAEGRWDELKAALDNVQNDVREEVQQMGEDELVVLASTGGWIEGLRVVSAHLASNYSADKAELLNQARLIEYFLEEMDGMSPTVTSHPIVASTRGALEDLSGLLNAEGEIDQTQITRMVEITSQLVDQIESGRL